jgi:hypothetical protein
MRERMVENKPPAEPTRASTMVGFSGESVQPDCACRGAAIRSRAAAQRKSRRDLFIGPSSRIHRMDSILMASIHKSCRRVARGNHAGSILGNSGAVGCVSPPFNTSSGTRRKPAH